MVMSSRVTAALIKSCFVPVSMCSGKYLKKKVGSSGWLIPEDARAWESNISNSQFWFHFISGKTFTRRMLEHEVAEWGNRDLWGIVVKFPLSPSPMLYNELFIDTYWLVNFNNNEKSGSSQCVCGIQHTYSLSRNNICDVKLGSVNTKTFPLWLKAYIGVWVWITPNILIDILLYFKASDDSSGRCLLEGFPSELLCNLLLNLNLEIKQEWGS